MQIDLVRRYKRWRHGRGFGIHSPFAYDFITRTLRERLPYYAYDSLDAKAAAESIRLRRLRLLFRIAVRFNPATVAIVGERHADAEVAAVKAARSTVKVTGDPAEADMVIVNDDSQAVGSVGQRAVVVFPDKAHGGSETCERVWSSVSRGMRFDNSGSFTIIVCSPTLPRQSFEVKF